MGKWSAILILTLLSWQAQAQMGNGLDTLYGNEWIENTNPYAKLSITDDGMYRIGYAELQALGWPLASISSNQFQLFFRGEEIPYYSTVASDLPLGPGDYLVFYAQKNRGELDRYLYRDAPNQQLNPHYSLYDDTASYYLTWSDSPALTYASVNNDLTNLPAAEPYVWKTVEEVFDDHFLKEYYRFSSATIYYSHYGVGEGYGNRNVNQLLAAGETSQQVVLPLPNAYTNGPAAQLSTRYVAALNQHIQRLSANEVEIRLDSFFNWRLLNVDTPLPGIVLAEEELRLNWDGLVDDRDEVSVGFVKVDYPTQTIGDNLNNYQCRMSSNGEGQYLELANFGSSSAIVYDYANHYRIEVNNILGGLLRVALPAAENDRQLEIIATDANLSTPEMQSVDLSIPDLSNNPEYVILTHSSLRTNGDPVQAYADYRSSASGGSYRTVVVDIDPLFDIYAYGVQQHPLAIRNFVARLRKDNPEFKYLFIVGKGREYTDLRTPGDLEAALETTLFVPTFGFPGADNLLVSDWSKPTPKVGIGRLPVVSPEEVVLYLNKVQSMEASLAQAPATIEARSWTKNILHLGGGGNPGEQQSIRNSLQNMATEIEEGLFGANINAFYKTSLDPIAEASIEGIFETINNGVSLITFFGHSSASGFDFSIDQPERYENVNKYPMMMSLGCYSGNMFDEFRSIGEDFLLLEDGGASAFLASRGLGFIHALSNTGRSFHGFMSNETYGQPISDGIIATIREYEAFTDIAYGTLNEQFNLQGDPGLRLNAHPGEDYLIDANSVVIKPAIVNVEADSFLVSFDLYNIGAKISDSIVIELGQLLPNGVEVIHYTTKVSTPAYSEQISLMVPSLGRPSVGLNRLLLRVDPMNTVTEQASAGAESNNELVMPDGQRGFPFFIIDDAAIPVWPRDYSLVGQAPITLKASTANALAEEQKYFLAIATDPDFNTVLAETQITSFGGVLKWTPEVSWQDSIVYYWRIAPDTLGSVVPTFAWESSSFQYIEGIDSGWGQAHWGQWGGNVYENVYIDSTSRALTFAPNALFNAIRNKVWDPDDKPTYFNGNQNINSPWTFSVHQGVNVIVIPYPTLDYWRNPPGGLYGSVNTAGWPSGVLPFAYPTLEQEDRANLINFLTEVVPDSAYVVFYTAQRNLNSDYEPEEWAADSINLNDLNIFNVLEMQGATEIRHTATEGATPYVFIYQKDVEPIAEARAEFLEGDAVAEGTFRGAWYQGEMMTIPAGQVPNWNRLNVQFSAESIESTDSLRLQLEGSNSGDIWEVVWETTGPAQSFYTYDLSDVNTNANFLRLRYFAYDIDNRTLPQPDFIHLLHDPMAELAINANRAYSLTDSLQEGQSVSLIYAIENLGDETMTEVPINYLLSNFTTELPNKIIESLAPDEIYLDSVNITSQGTQGIFEIIATINPADTPQEGQRFNNVVVNRGQVYGDEIDPVVHVVFDGQQILDGDLVAAAPLVSIKIEDENLFLPLEDESIVRLELLRPETGSFTFVPSEEYTFTPADISSGKNIARIDFEPQLLIDGIYALRLRATDQTGNTAGRLLYEVTFEVINRQTISHILPYPNPFVDQTRFVYTMTGDPPSRFRIQIMTTSGRIVKDISQAEFGDLQVGTHQSDYIWDGRDNYGDQLANGVYLYRVLAEDASGEAIEIRDNGSSSYFLNGLGKIVILR